MSYASAKRIINLVCIRRLSTKREMASSLRDCLDTPDRRKRPWKPWILLTLVLTALYFLYCYNKIQNSMETLPKVPCRTENKIAKKKKEPTIQVMHKTQKPLIKVSEPEVLKDIAVFINDKDKEQPTKSWKANVYCIPNKNNGTVTIIKPSSNVTLEKVYPMVEKGGYYHPADCSPKHTVGILVPYRDREASLRVFMYNIHPFLMDQQLEYRIFLIEQFGFKPFNKGCLFNAGFKEMLKFHKFDCVVLHDVDLLPTNQRIMYSCPTLPRHMCAYIRKKDHLALNITTTTSLFGGVTSMTVEQYKRANGYSNLYYGWGGEDNDMFYRLHAAGYPVLRYNRSIAVYAMLPHIRAPVNPERHHLLATAIERYKSDGLSDINYAVVSTKFNHLYTHIVIDVDPSTTYKYN